MPQVPGVLLDHVDEDPADAVGPPATIHGVERGIGGETPGHGDLGPIGVERTGQRGVGRRVKVTILVAVGVGVTEEQRWCLLAGDAAAKPPALDIGEVTQQPEDRHVARRAGGEAGLVVGEPLGLAGHHRPLEVEELEQGHSLVGVATRVGGRVGHSTSFARRRVSQGFDTVTSVRTVILGDPPVEIEALIESRRSTGADRRDEIWEGDYHMNPAPRKRHAILVSELLSLIHPCARRRGLVGTTDFNLGVPNDYRIPDAGVHRDAADAVYVDSAPLVIEVLSPDDETMEKLPFYAARGVDEVVIADPMTRAVQWLRLDGGAYVETRRSEVLDIDVAEIVTQIDWPPVD